MSDYIQKVNANNIGGDVINGHDINVTTNLESNQNLAQAAKDIQALLEQLEKTNPATTDLERVTIAAKAADEINGNPTLKARVINALKSGGTETFKEAVNNPIVNILVAIIQGWTETK